MIFNLSFSTQRYYRIAVSTFFFIQGLTFASWASRIPDIKNMLGLSDAGLGGVLFFLPIGQLCAMALSGYLVSKFGSKTTLTIAALLYPSVLLGIGLVTKVWQLSAGLFFFGMCGNLCNISVNTQGVGVERLYRRSIMASFHGVWSLAGFTGGLISTIMVGNNISPFVHFCCNYTLVLLLFLLVRNSILPRDNKPVEKTNNKVFVKPDSYIIYLGVIVFSSMICEGTMFDWSSIYFEKVIHLPKELIRLGYIAFMCTMASGRFAADWLVTKFGITRIQQTSGIIIASGLLISVLFPYLITATIGFLLVGIGTSSVVPLCYSLAGKSKTMLPGIALATVSSIGFLGFLLGPPIIGFIAQLSSLRWSFTLIALLGLLTTIMANKLKNSISNQ
jgi:MFS family permease